LYLIFNPCDNEKFFDVAAENNLYIHERSAKVNLLNSIAKKILKPCQKLS